MARILKTIAIGGLALAMPAVAFAADLPPPPVYYYPPPTPPSEWYLRLDAGFKLYRDPDVTFDLPALGFDVPGDGEFTGETIGPTGVVGFGIGHDFGVFRADITADYEWPGHFEGYLVCPAVCPGPNPDPEYSFETADIAAWTFLINGYIDIGTFGGAFTPYVGAGIGASRLTTSNVYFVNPDGSEGPWQGMTTWNLAWALMGGLAVDMTQRFSIDVNYRYVHLGTAMAMTTLGGGTPIVYDNIAAHEVRLGLRYSVF